jgi:hypothetical protein
VRRGFDLVESGPSASDLVDDLGGGPVPNEGIYLCIGGITLQPPGR